MRQPLIIKKTTYRYSLTRAGYTDSNITVPLSLKWFYKTRLQEDYIYNPKVNCTLIAEDKILYFSTLENTFCAFDSVKKEYKWRYNTIGNVYAGATLSGDDIIFGDTKGYLYCLDKGTGKVLWQNKFNNEIISSPLPIEDKVFFTDMGDSLYSASKDSGNILWKRELESYLQNIVMRDISSPSYKDGFIYQGFSDGYLYCFDANTSKEKFRKKIKNKGKAFYDVDAPAVIDGNTVYSSSYDGAFLAVSADKPETKWQITIKGNGYSAFNNDCLIVSTNEGSLYSIGKDFGNIVWERALSPNLTPPIITDKYIFVASEDYLYVVDISNGEVQYEYEPGSGINSELCIVGNNLYFLSNKGYLYCLESK